MSLSPAVIWVAPTLWRSFVSKTLRFRPIKNRSFASGFFVIESFSNPACHILTPFYGCFLWLLVWFLPSNLAVPVFLNSAKHSLFFPPKYDHLVKLYSPHHSYLSLSSTRFRRLPRSLAFTDLRTLQTHLLNQSKTPDKQRLDMVQFQFSSLFSQKNNNTSNIFDTNKTQQ